MKAKNVIGKLFDYDLDSIIQISFRDKDGRQIFMNLEEVESYVKTKYIDAPDERVIVFKSNEMLGNFASEIYVNKDGKEFKVFNGNKKENENEKKV